MWFFEFYIIETVKVLNLLLRKVTSLSDILNLACLRIRRKWKNSLLFFLVLLFSFSSVIVSVSLVGSISLTNAEYRLNTYGEWYFAIPYGYDNYKDWLSKKDWAESIGTAKSYGTIISSDGIIGLGTIDSELADIGRIRTDQGRFPLEDGEIAMEADSLSALGYDYTLGQEITVSVMIPAGESPYDFLMIEKTYTLCGIIHEYSNLWYLDRNESNQTLNSALVTEAEAMELIEQAKRMIMANSGLSIRSPVPQYFISVSEENRELAEEQINGYLAVARKDGNGDVLVSVNSVAYPGGVKSGDYNDFYMYIIAFLTFVSILCLGIIQLPSYTYSFSVLRSIGMSKVQLCLMQLSETAVLGIPAILLGIPLGALLTRFSLRMTLYSGSVPIQVYIPFQTLFSILVLWLAAIFISRLIIFILTLRVPMIGRFRPNGAKSGRIRLLRNGFIVLLLCVYTLGVIFTGVQALNPERKIRYWSNMSHYVVTKLGGATVSPSDAAALKNIPGVSDVYGFSEEWIGLSYEGMSEGRVYLFAAEGSDWADMFDTENEETEFRNRAYLFAINENDWADIFDFGEDITDFHSGEIVLICIPEDGNEYERPEGEVKLSFYGDKEKLLSEYTVDSRIRYIPENVFERTVACIRTPYTAVCSEQFLKRIIGELPEGERWGRFKSGQDFEYGRVFVMADLNSDDLSTDIVLANTCKNRGIWLSNRRQEYLSYKQENVQAVIMLYFSGTCICVIALMILCGNISLETENEKRSFLIKRCIGMSRRQAGFSILGKTLIRCGGAYAAGWLMYFSLVALIKTNTYDYGDKGFLYILQTVINGLKYDGFTLGRFAVISCIYLIVPIVLILLVKKELRKDGDIK